MHQFGGKKKHVHSLHKVIKDFYTLYQGPDDTRADPLKAFKARLAVIEDNRGQVYLNPGLMDAQLKNYGIITPHRYVQRDGR